MCTPNAYAAFTPVGKPRNDFSVEGVNLNNLKDAPRKLSLPSTAQFSTLPGISLNTIEDPTRQHGAQYR